MDRKKMVTAVVTASVVSLAVAYVAASPWALDTPLYTYRMEQISSKMSFLPTEMNSFIYMTEKGCDLNYDSSGCCGAQPFEVTEGITCEGTCVEPTCPRTCRYTCDDPTCQNTCPNTCGSTCDTCYQTCDTCEQTCAGWITCGVTCEFTCISCVTCLTCGPQCGT